MIYNKNASQCPVLLTRSTLVFAFPLAVLMLAVSSYIAIPMIPVPITAQTYAVFTIGAIFGPVLGAGAVAVWLICGAIGLPVLAGGAAGLEPFSGPTAGFLFAFPIAAFVVGSFVARRQAATTVQRGIWIFAAGVVGHTVCLGLGALWLAATIGIHSALVNGFYPFIPGGIIKSAAVTLTVLAIERRKLGAK